MKKKKGLASASEKTQKRVASQGGTAVLKKHGTNYYVELGRIGGRKTSSDREHMRKIGRKGGIKTSSDREHMAELGRKKK